jgi:glycyl-tRNA synthetase
VLELGFEELPPDQVTSFTDQLSGLLEAALSENRLDHSGVTAFGSPRRIIARVEGLAARQPDRASRVRGPRVDAAFAPDGTPTRAAEGFARKHGVDVSALSQAMDGESTYVFVDKDEEGRRAGDVLSEQLPGVISSIASRRAMRWGAGPSFSASRALRWIVALVGDAVVSFSYADVTSGRRTRVLRNAVDPVLEIASAADLLPTLRSNEIEYDGAVRARRILEETHLLTAEVSGEVNLSVDGTVLTEVTNMVENPQVLMGSFDEEYLRLPAEVLTVVMKKHQRYLPVRTADGALMPRFVSIANGTIDVDAVRAGNEAVLRARYADAAFFFDRDRERPLAKHRAGLAKLTFEENVGSMLDRSERIARLAAVLAVELSLDDEESETLERAAHLAKADLATSLVVELSSLAGQMGRVYALADGEPQAVADAIFEGVLPRFAGDDLPASRVGAVLSIADRADALVALFATGAKPTGSNDPYALRRAATGLVQVVARHSLRISLHQLFRAAAVGIDLPVGEDLLFELRDFVDTRLEVRLVDEGHRVEFVRALAPRFDRPSDVVEGLAELENSHASAAFSALSAAYRRVLRISTDATAGEIDENLLAEPAEIALWSAFAPLEATLQQSRLREFVGVFQPLVPAIEAFFADVMVMADDERIRANRLALLARVREAGSHLLLDWDALPDA